MCARRAHPLTGQSPTRFHADLGRLTVQAHACGRPASWLSLTRTGQSPQEHLPSPLSGGGRGGTASPGTGSATESDPSSPRRALLGAKMPVMVKATPGRGETGPAARNRCSQGPARSSSRNPERGATRTTIPAPPSCKQAAQDQDSQISGSADSWSASSSRPKTFSKPGRS